MIKRKSEVDYTVLIALDMGVFAWEQLGKPSVENWYRNENLTLKLAKSVKLEFCTPTNRGSQEILEVYNHLVDFANQMESPTKVSEVSELFDLDIELPHRVSSEELLVLAATSTSKKEIDRIIKDHSGCISSEECNRCKIISENAYESVVYALAENPNLDAKQQKKVLDLAVNDQIVMHSLVRNPQASPETKSFLTQGEFWYELDDDAVTRIIEDMESNPSFTDSEIAEFRAFFEDAWGYGQDSDSED